jgi:hypothetical protein
MFAFRPPLKPTPPPEPKPPAPRPPPTPTDTALNFSRVFLGAPVLQMAPARAALYGFVGTDAAVGGYSRAKVSVAWLSVASRGIASHRTAALMLCYAMPR